MPGNNNVYSDDIIVQNDITLKSPHNAVEKIFHRRSTNSGRFPRQRLLRSRLDTVWGNLENMECKRQLNLRSRAAQQRKRKWKSTGIEAKDEKNKESLDQGSSSSDLASKISKLQDDEATKLEENQTNILHLPNEVLGSIVTHLEAKAIGRLAATCRRFNDIVSENLFWKVMCGRHFRFWDHKTPLDDGGADDGVTSSQCAASQHYTGSWKRQYALNHTKGIRYQMLGSGHTKKFVQTQIVDTSSAFGFKKLCCSRDHVFALDLACCLQVFRWERHPMTSEHIYKKVEWHQEFAKHVIDVTTDPRYDNNHRRYVYVLTQSEGMRSRRNQPNTRSAGNSPVSGWDRNGSPISGDKIDVFDERTCRRVFNMTFDPEMRFISMKLTSVTSQQKTLFILTDAGKVYSLHLYESSLLNLGSEGMQVTLKSASKSIGEKVGKLETSVGIVSFLSESGKLFIIAQRRSEFSDIFGREIPARVGTPQQIPHVAKIVTCSVGDRHLGFVDEYNRVFLVGNNRYGQLGTGDRMDRHNPVQVLCQHRVRLIYCGLNHTIAVVETGSRCEMLGAGSGNSGRLPGKARGCVEFTRLNVKVPWSVRQVDAHKECLFLLSCFDVDDQFEYKQRVSPFTDQRSELLALKSQQELLMELRKAKLLADKLRIVETMVEHVTRQHATGAATLAVKEAKPGGASSVAAPTDATRSAASLASWKQRQAEDLKTLRTAVEQVRLEADRIALDQHILNAE